MKRALPPQEEWPLCLLAYVGGLVTEALYSYFDFLSWHSTCHTLWRPLEDHFYGEYLLRFLDDCEEWNRVKALETSHSDFHRQIRILRSVRVVHLLVNDLLLVMRAEPHAVWFAMPATQVGNRLWVDHDPESPHLLMLSTALTLDRFILHMKHRYGWELAFVERIQRTNQLPFPTPCVDIKSYRLEVSPVGLAKVGNHEGGGPVWQLALR